MALDIIELRAYARAKQALKDCKDASDVPNDPMIETVFEVEAEVLRRRREEGTP